MADERVVSKKLEQIEQYHGELKAKQRSLSRADFLRETTEQRAVERMFENAIQACSDLAQHVATNDFDFEGSASKEALRVLGQEGVIDEETMNTLVAAIGFRNVLAHEYGKVEYSQVYETLQTGLGVYDAFSQQLAQWFRNKG
ncbi:type VII toxin-antitoxin system HepT family RNase toxin [Halorussus halophilus]|uniref:type VII toxin-antitoxin system HepT family RNase toxin n=1 Tax=Halorussus halophilus TaxID=2650975 RepID=UPI0013017E59|nr:DUF86 domain-containing protein [Halorussus halophilus]